MEDSIYINRLKERLRQKPETRLFLSLAEEMQKRDKTEEAIAILVDGIKRNPDFIAARLTLGRWYLSYNMLPEAKKEFLEVLVRSPENIHARQRLAEVNKKLGIDEEEAIASRLNRFLEDIKTRFSPENIDPSQDSDRNKEAIVNRLNRFLEAIKTQFSSKNRDFDRKVFVKNRLNKFLEAIRSHFASMPVSSN